MTQVSRILDMAEIIKKSEDEIRKEDFQKTAVLTALRAQNLNLTISPFKICNACSIYIVAPNESDSHEDSEDAELHLVNFRLHNRTSNEITWFSDIAPDYDWAEPLLRVSLRATAPVDRRAEQKKQKFIDLLAELCND